MLLRAICIVVLVFAAGCLDGDFSDESERPFPPPDRVRLMLTDAADRIVIRAYYIEGREPHPEATDWFVERLGEITGKTHIEILPAVPVSFGSPSTQTNWTGERAFEAFLSLGVPIDPGAFTLPLLYLDGHGWNGYTVSAGWQNPSYIALFPDTYRRGGLTQPIDLTFESPAYDGDEDRRVLLHEAGHMLGLVNNGLPMQKEHVDRADPCVCHSDNPESLMYTGNHPLLERAQRGFRPVLDLDDDDRADIRAFQQAATTT